jgi:hypothetical protein
MGGLNKSVCQARLNTSQPLLPAEICIRSRRLMPDYGTCRTSARPDYRNCSVFDIHDVKELALLSLSGDWLSLYCQILYFFLSYICSKCSINVKRIGLEILKDLHVFSSLNTILGGGMQSVCLYVLVLRPLCMDVSAPFWHLNSFTDFICIRYWTFYPSKVDARWI